MFFLLYRRATDAVSDEFPKISDQFPKISEDFLKLFRKQDERFRTFFENFRGFSEDCRGRPKKIRTAILTSLNDTTLAKVSYGKYPTQVPDQEAYGIYEWFSSQ